MNLRPITRPELEVRLTSLLKRHPRERAFALRGRAMSLDGSDLILAGKKFVIRDAKSPLDVRQALVGLESSDCGLVLLTEIDEHELGEDVRARLARHAIIDRKPWEMLMERLGIRRIDARLAAHEELAEILITREPEGGWPPIVGGALDATEAWRLLLKVALPRVRDDEPFDLQALLEWSLKEDNCSHWRNWPEPHRAIVLEAIEETAGKFARALLKYLLNPDAVSLVSLGLVANCLVRDPASADTGAEVERVRGKLEARLTLPSISNEELWALAQAALAISRREHAGSNARRITEARRESDDLLKEMGASGLAIRSDVIPSGFELRLTELAAALEVAINEPSKEWVNDLERSSRRVIAHMDAQRNRLRADRLEMMVRLVRWLSVVKRGNGTVAKSFSEAFEQYRAEGGFVDWARSVLWRAESNEKLASSLRRLDSAIREVREEQNRDFGRRFVQWNDKGESDSSMIPIERVLGAVVGPLAKERAILLLVIDGMSMAVYRELVPDVLRSGWDEILPPNRTHRYGVVAGVPSVTEVSRASLFSGSITRGDRHDESEAFQKNHTLVAVSGGGKHPRLFHKGELSEWSDKGKSSAVFDALRDPKQKVIGVVLNDVDDHLAKSEPVQVDWGCKTISPLSELLELAAQSNRIVILTSDHGHVLEHDMEVAPDASGERFRDGSQEPREYEIKLEGMRVNEHVAVLPWSERVRYGMKKYGYHGGASPQEIVVPLGVFVADRHMPKGWQLVGSEMPVWWEADAEIGVTTRISVPKKAKRKDDKSLPDLFATPTPNEEAATIAIPDWVESLLQSSMYKEQRSLAGPGMPERARVVRLLAALDARGGRLTRAAVLNALEIPSMRLQGFLSGVQRLLNVDGYAVISVDLSTGEVKLDSALLATQFGIKV